MSMVKAWFTAVNAIFATKLFIWSKVGVDNVLK